MRLKNKEKRIIGNNPFAVGRRTKMRKRLYNRDFTLLTPNCMGGILLHDLGLKFLTPTINLMFTQTDFLQFVLHLEEYINGELSFYDDPQETCPCAHLQFEDCPILTIYFTHYSTEDEARRKWEERVKRINRQNLFVVLEERDEISNSDLKKLAGISARGVMVFTCNNYPDLPYCVFLKKYHSSGEVGNILRKNLIDDSREYERYFDFVRWFNEANGRGYDVSDYIIR